MSGPGRPEDANPFSSPNAPSFNPGSFKPHRGTTILVLGILGLVCCAPFGIAAWVMGNSDLAEMRAGSMDRSGEPLTRAGQIMGIISCVLLIISLGLFAVSFMVQLASM